jgi:L-iditol 2-dehydrogenase
VGVVRLHAPRDVRFHRERVEDPGPGEVLLQVRTVGLCGSDRHWFIEGSIGDAQLSRPLVLGHEFGGVIAQGDRAGQRVVADPADACGACDPCSVGRPNLCRSVRFAGHGTTDGALRTFMSWPGRLLRPVPERVSDDEVALLEPLGIALHAFNIGHPPAGGAAAVIGCGPIGLMLVALLRRAAVRTVVAADPLAHRRAAATSMGASHTVPAGAGLRAAVRSSAVSEVDVAFEAAGDNDALADAMAAVRPGGQVVIVGIPPHDQTTFAASVARRKGLTMVYSRRMLPIDLERAIELVTEGAIDLAALISHRYPIERATEAFETLAVRAGLKVVVNPSPARA